MKRYDTENIRNVCLVGAKGVGKTSLAEAILFNAKVTTRLGKVADGTTSVDYDPLEIAHKESLTSKVLAVEWKNTKVNFLDTPGYADFFGEALSALWVSDVVCLTVDAASSSQISTQKFYKLAATLNKPLVFFVNRLDVERANWNRAWEQIRNLSQGHAVLFGIPVGEGQQFKSVVDLVTAEQEGEARKYHTELLEAAAETNESLMEKYLEKGELTEDELKNALSVGIAHRDFFPVFVGSSTSNLGIASFLNTISDYFPSPYLVNSPPCKHKGQTESLSQDPKGPLAAQVFKVTSDPGLGEIFYLKLYSGTLQHGIDLFNTNKSSVERVGHLFVMRGKERIEIPEAEAGDIIATAKLKQTNIGDTLTLKQEDLKLDPIPFPQPVVSLALKAPSKQDQDKLGIGLSKLVTMDPTFKMHIDKEFGETIVEGMGEQHIEIIVKRLKEKFGVEATLGKPHIPYRETPTKKTEAQGKYKRQTGGHGQYGDCWLRIEPLPRGKGFEFGNEIRGGAIPSKFIPSVEKGVREALNHGVAAGYLVVDIKVAVYDGSYHDVDSSDLAFQIAGSMALKNAEEQAHMQLLEPIMNVEVTTPAQYVGDVTSDISARRGRVQAMENSGEIDTIRAQVPMAELYKYSTSLRSFTSGAASYSMTFSHYEPVPPHLAAKIIEEAKREKEIQGK